MNKIRRVMGLAIISSLISKISGFGYQVLSIPLIAKMLGTNDFSLFLVYSGFSAWLSLLALGVAPTLTSLAADKSKTEELSSAFFTSMMILTLLFGFFALVLSFFAYLLSSDTIIFSANNISIMWCAYALFSINIIFSVGDAINQGQQKQHINNIFFSVANGINMIMIYSFFLFFGKQSLVIVFILSQIGFILTRVINSLMVLRRIGVTGKIFTLIFFKEFLKNSSSFLFVQLAVLISQQAIVMLCLEKINAQVSGQISLVFRTYAILGSIIAMINQPLWPLLRSAIINGELAWVKRIFFKIYKIYALYGFVIILMLAFFGHVIFGYWVSKVYNFDVKASILVGIQFSLICLSQGNVVVLMGLGAFSQLAKILMLEATLAYISTYAAILIGYNLDLSNILWILIFSNILTSLWILPKNTLRLLNVK